MSVKITRITDTAAPNGQFFETENRFRIKLPINNDVPPPNASAVKYAPKDGINTKMTLAKIPGAVKGNVTLKNVGTRFAPKSFEASSSDLSIFSIEEYIGSTAYGKNPYSKPNVTA